MKKAMMCIVFATAVLLGCNSNSNKPETAEFRSSDQTYDCGLTVNNFIRWYKENLRSLSAINIVKYDADSFYRVDFSNAEIYLSKLRRSGLFTEGFLAQKEQYFIQHDSILSQLKQNDGPPDGFETDLLLFSHEVETLLGDTSNIAIQTLSKDVKEERTKMKWFDNNRIFVVKRSGSKCLIDSITFIE